MLDIEDFESVFPSIGYTNAIVHQIDEHKKMLGGKTFFERLLELLSIKWRRIYPPSSDDQLRELHKRIVNAPISLHYKHCLFFYVLKDLSPAWHDQTELATKFAGDVHLESRFWTFIEGLWALDHLQCETAVGHLTHPSIIPTFPDEIMMVLLHYVRSHGQSPTATILPLAYYNCANPPLVGQDVKNEFVRYMADRNVTETFYWIRARPEHEQKPLLQVFVEEILDQNGWDREEEQYKRQEKALELVSLPLTEEEEIWIETFLTEGKGRNYRNALDTVQMRRIASGRLKEAANEATAKGRKHDQVNWEILRDGIKRGLGDRKDEANSFIV